MGQMVHHAIIVTTCRTGGIEAAHAQAAAIFGARHITAPVESRINGFWSFLIPPDGSNAGWIDSDQGDARRARFHAWIAAQAYDDDGSNRYDAVEVAYGELAQPVITVVDGHATDARLEGR